MCPEDSFPLDFILTGRFSTGFSYMLYYNYPYKMPTIQNHFQICYDICMLMSKYLFLKLGCILDPFLSYLPTYTYKKYKMT